MVRLPPWTGCCARPGWHRAGTWATVAEPKQVVALTAQGPDLGQGGGLPTRDANSCVKSGDSFVSSHRYAFS